MKVLAVVGARPNIMKFAAWNKAINGCSKILSQVVVHSGQHYDDDMFYDIWNAFELPEINYNLRVGSGSHPWQIGTIMIGLEKVIALEQPDWVIAIDDVNTALAAALTARKMGVKVAHIEAGIRCNDKSMPEEINRILVDHTSDLLFAPCQDSYNRLLLEGIKESCIELTGNFMADSLLHNLAKSNELSIEEIIEKKNLNGFCNQIGVFVLFTLHRPSNVNNVEIFRGILEFILEESYSFCESVVWTIHPGVLKLLKESELYDRIMNSQHIHLLSPVGYFEMIKLVSNSSFVLTDSGGLQEETSILGTPCLTMRNSTERPSTLIENGGTNRLIGNLPENLKKACLEVMSRVSDINIPYWDGNAAERALTRLVNF